MFNIAQVDGYEAPAPQPLTLEPLAAVDALVHANGALIRHGGERAFYRPSTDTIHMPHPTRFESTEAYYAVLLHEHVHWVGHRSRCDRTANQSYAFEELVAELGAAFLCAELGVSATPREDHAPYIKGWLSALREDHKVIGRAAAAASKAVRHLRAACPEAAGEAA